MFYLNSKTVYHHMKKLHLVLLFVICILLVLLVHAQDITSIVDLFTLHPVDYILLFLWAGIFFLLLLPLAIIGRKFLFVLEKNQA